MTRPLRRRIDRADPSTQRVLEPLEVALDDDVAVVACRKRIALVAQDNRKVDLLEWAQFNRDLLGLHELLSTGTTGTMLEEALRLPVTKLRIAVVWNIPVACNRASADYLISSPLLNSAYQRQMPGYDAYQNRFADARDVAEAAILSAAEPRWRSACVRTPAPTSFTSAFAMRGRRSPRA